MSLPLFLSSILWQNDLILCACCIIASILNFLSGFWCILGQLHADSPPLTSSLQLLSSSYLFQVTWCFFLIPLSCQVVTLPLNLYLGHMFLFYQGLSFLWLDDIRLVCFPLSRILLWSLSSPRTYYFLTWYMVFSVNCQFWSHYESDCRNYNCNWSTITVWHF